MPSAANVLALSGLRVKDDVGCSFADPPDVTVSWNAAKKELTCRAVGNPDKYNFTSWTHEVDQTVVRKVPGDHTAGTDTSTISLTGQKPYMDTGIYTCGVSNGIAGRTNSLLQTKNETVEMPGIVSVCIVLNVLTSLVGSVQDKCSVWWTHLCPF